MAAVFNAGYDDAFPLIYRFPAAESKGKNLKEIRCAIQHGCCEFIEEYHESSLSGFIIQMEAFSAAMG